MADDDWMTGLPKTGRGRTRVQMPMQTHAMSDWETMIRASVSKNVEACVAAQPPLTGKDSRRNAKLRRSLASHFVGTDELFQEAIAMHIGFYGAVASTEVGFDLGIKPNVVVIGGSDDYAVVFATMDIEACAALRSLEGVQEIYGQLLRIRRKRVKSSGDLGRVHKSESLMDLLVAALPYTTQTIGMATPLEIVNRAVEQRLQQL